MIVIADATPLNYLILIDQETSFFVDPALIESLLDEEARRKQRS